MTLCARCGTAFECGMTDASAPCWCASLPALPADAYVPDKADPAASHCFCSHCLRGLLAAAMAKSGD